MKDFALSTETEKGTFDIVYVKAETLELAKEKVFNQNKKRLASPIFKDKVEKIIKIAEFK